MTSILALSTSIYFENTIWPKTITEVVMKWHISQYKASYFSWHLSKTLFILSRHILKELPNIVSTMSLKIINMHFWNVARALQVQKAFF